MRLSKWLMVLGFLGAMGCTKHNPDAYGTCGPVVQMTWLGVTNYAIQYEYNGKDVNLLLDHQINGAYFDEVMTTLGFDTIDYVFIGHNHFDHTGACVEQDDFLCSAALALYGEPALPWVGAPYTAHAHSDYGAHIVGPHNLCEGLGQSACTGLWSMDGVQTIQLNDIGLTLRVFPSAHSSEFGELDFEREHPDDDEPDPFTFIFEFPANEDGCHQSMLWANSTLTKAPYLNYTETLTTEETQWAFDYQALLQEAINARSGEPITYWAFWGSSLPEQAWQTWADVVQPKYWSNHHHGSGSGEFFPDLHKRFDGLAIGGTETEPASDWIDTEPSAAVEFLPLDSFWTTTVLKDGEAMLKPEIQTKLSQDFQTRVAASLGL